MFDIEGFEIRHELRFWICYEIPPVKMNDILVLQTMMIR